MAEPQPIRALRQYFSITAQEYPEQSALFLNAGLPGNLDDATFLHYRNNNLICEQPQRGKYLNLQSAGFDVSPHLQKTDHSFDQAWVCLGKFKGLNEQNIVKALNHVKPIGRIIVCGAKHSGISSLKRTLASSFSIGETYAKFHSQVFEFPANSGDVGNLNCPSQNDIKDNGANFRTGAGLFSANRIDKGSKLLCNNFNHNISGQVADLGAGWGYLSHQLLDQCSDINSLHLFETEWQGLEAAKLNLEQVNSNAELLFSWRDIVREPIEVEYKKKFDWVIMNPPFHEGRAKDVSIGGQFITKAAKILKPSGRLLMVANRNLPYESELRNSFRQFQVLEETNRFKVILAKV